MYQARYYDAWLGRFISADTIVPGPFDPQALNRYSYVRNNPVNLTDPSGHFFVALVAHFLGAPDWVAGILDPFGTLSGVLNDWDIGAMALQQGIAAASAFTGGATVKALGGKYLSYLAGAVVSAATSSALYDLAGHDVNYGQSILTSLAISVVTLGVGEIPVANDFHKMAAGFVASGIAAELNGGDFSMSLVSGFSVSAAGFMGSYVVRHFTAPSQEQIEIERGKQFLKDHPDALAEYGMGGEGPDHITADHIPPRQREFIVGNRPPSDPVHVGAELNGARRSLGVNTREGFYFRDSDVIVPGVSLYIQSGNVAGESAYGVWLPNGTTMQTFKGRGFEGRVTIGAGGLKDRYDIGR